MKILVIRHGQSEADILKVCEGRADYSLTDKGIADARTMARYVTGRFKIDRIYSSPLLRAKQTAEEILKLKDCPIDYEDDLMEFNNGQLAGCPFSEVQERFPVIEGVPPHESVYGQESKLAFRARAEKVLSKILSENHPEDTVALVTHGGMINQLFKSFLRIPYDINVWVENSDCSVSLWVSTQDSRGIVFSNFSEFI
ncbi:MAG: histidine phosphatase family protein [Clostridiaceae bacterium]